MGKTTRAMVAERAGVSLPMVSYVINNSRPVSEKTREKVLAAIRELNYVPDIGAQSMVTHRSHCFAVIANTLMNPMYGEIVQEFERAAFSEGYSTIICSGCMKLSDYLPVLIARKIDGLYFASTPDKVQSADIERLLENGISVSCGNYLLPDENRVSRLDIDYENGMRQAISVMRKTGHRQLLYVNGFPRDFSRDVRCDAFRKYAAEFGYGTDGRILYGQGIGHMEAEDGYLLGLAAADAGVPFDGCICASDSIAYGVLSAFRERGVRVPDDCSVIGFENLPTSALVSPSLSSMRFDIPSFSSCAVRQLLESSRTGKVTRDLIPMSPVLRDSIRVR